MTGSGPTPRWTPLRYHPVQHRLQTIRLRRREGLPFPHIAYVWAGRRSGKTEILKREVVMASCEPKPWPNPRYFLGGPTHDQAKAIFWDDLNRLVPSGWVRKRSDSELFVRMVWGAEIHVLGLDKPARMEGPPWDGGGIDESCDQKLKVFEKSVWPAVADRKGWVWRVGVPKRDGPSSLEFREKCEAAERGELPDAEAFHWKSADVLDKATIDTYRRTMDPKTFREQFEAEWETASGLVYYAFDRKLNVRPCCYDPTLPIHVGSDFNMNPMAWELAQDKPGSQQTRLEVFDELYVRDANTEQTLDLLFSRYPNHAGGWHFYGDATGQGRRTSASQSDYQWILNDRRFEKAGRSVHYPASNPRQPDRYASVNAMLRNALGEARLIIDPKCVHLIQDLDSVTYSEGTREASKDVPWLTHSSDGLGYMVHWMYPIWSAANDEPPNPNSRFGVGIY